MLRVRVTVSVLASLLVLSQQCTPPPPAIGDIRLVPYNEDSTLTGFYEVQIYYTDGTTHADFGGVCADDSYKKESTVICHQLGYKYIDFQYRSTNTPLWFSNIRCDDSNTPHILRCQTKVMKNADRNNANICGPKNQRLLVRCDFSQPLHPYDGQVALCPVYTTSPNISSTSFGLLGIYYQDYGASNGINQRDGKPLGAYEADAICRQMGFTGAYPGTAVTRSADNYNFSHCFTNKMDNVLPFMFMDDGAWATTDDITCHEPQNCLGCCLKYPYRGDCGNCDTQHNLVIRCAFDPTKVKHYDGTAGSEDTCKLDGKKLVGHCASVDNSPDVIKHLKIALGVVVAMFLVLLVLLGPCGCYCICCYYKDNVHNRCKEKFKCVNLVTCCKKNYIPINEPIGNNQQNAQINNQNEPA